MAEWLGRGLQSLVQQFDSAPRLDRLSSRRLTARARRMSELSGERGATDGNQHGRDGDQTERDGCRDEESDNGGDDHQSGERYKDQRTTVFPHGSAQ